MVDLMEASGLIRGRTFISAFLFLALFCGMLNAAVPSSSVSITGSMTAVPPAYALANNTTSSNGSGHGISTILTPALGATAAIQKALERGPMVYAATRDYILVIDSSTLDVVSKIMPDVDTAHVSGVAVSPDGQFVYAVYSWSKYVDDYYGGHYDYYVRVVRINASTEQPMDYYEVDDVYPEHLAVSPDGKVYLGYQGAYTPENGGIHIMDFKGQKVWNIDMKYTTMMYDIEFSPDGNMVYYSGWWDQPSLYELDWSTNTVHYDELPGNASTDYYYTRSVALGKGGGMLYAAIKSSKGIFAMNTQDHGKQVIPTDYYPVALAASPDGETLYAMGYFEDSNGNPVYVVHRYDGLKTVGPFNSGLLDYSLSSSDDFYAMDSESYITPPSGDKPSRIAVTPDGRFAYVSTISGDSISDVHGDGIILYDLQYMNQVDTFDAKDSLHDVAASSSQIVFSPPADYGWAKQFAGSAFHGNLGSTILVPTSFYPANGTFAKHYGEDLFVIDADFSQVLDNSTVNSSTFWLTDGSGANVSAHVIAASKFAIMSPDSQLKPNTDYVAHLSHGIKSKDGEQLYADIEWGFTTRSVKVSSLAPATALLNMSTASKITPLLVLNLSMPLIVANNSSAGNQSAHLPPQARRSQNQSGNQSQGAQPSMPPQPGAQNSTQQGAQNATQPLPNASNQQPPAQPNVTQPAPNTTQPPASQPVTGYAPLPPQPPAQGGTGILDGIINFFKSLFGMK